MSVLRGLEQGDVTRGQAIRLLTYQAMLESRAGRSDAHRQAAAALRQLALEKH